MSPIPLDYDVLDAFHDGTIVAFDRKEDGSLLMHMDIEYLADRLEAGSTIIRTRFGGDVAPTVSFESTSSEDDATFPQDLLAEQDLDLTFLSLSDVAEAAGEELVMHCVGGGLRLSFSTVAFETESGVVISSETLKRASRLYWKRWSARGLAGRLDLGMRSATPTDLPVVRGLYSELLSVLATYNPTVDPKGELESDWVEKPGELFTWLFHRRAESGRLIPVGMALVCGNAYTEAMGENGDFMIFEFVITEKERGKGFGKAGLARVLDAHEGECSLVVLPQNRAAMGFWTAALDHYVPHTFLRLSDDGVEFMHFEFHTRVPLS